jgi:transcriptional regulator with XRE-family HTH domain
VRILKALQNVTYTEIAEHLEISRNSFYNWLKGYYNLSADKENRLNEIINLLSEV